MNKQESKLWEKLLPLLAKGAGGTAVMLVAVAAAVDLMIQSGPFANNILPALAAMLGNLFGDVVVGPFIDKLLSYSDDGFDELVNQFEKQLHQEDIRRDVAELLRKQDVLSNILGIALQYHEQQIVKQILHIISHYQELHSQNIIEQINNYQARLDPDIRYLTSLIYRLEGHEGPLEYVGLQGKAEPITEPRQAINRTRRKLLDPAFARIKTQLRTAEHKVSDNQVKTPLESIQQAVELYPRFILIGDPGAGKTTTLRRLALEAAWTRIGDSKAPIPLFKELSRWRDSQTLDEFISQNWPLDLDLSVAQVMGDVILYLDGLNEMGAKGQEKISHLKRWLNGGNKPYRAIITCRAQDYPTLNLNIPIVSIEPLDEPRIRAFAKNYMGDTADAFLEHVVPKYEREKENKRHLSHLASNPFLLRALMIIYDQIFANVLPDNIGGVFQNLIFFLWQREKERQTPNWVAYEKMLPAFSELAYQMIKDGQGTTVSLPYTLKYAEAPLLQVATKASIIRINSEQVSFYHQSMQEYLAANYSNSKYGIY